MEEITLRLLPHSEKLAPTNPYNLSPWPLYHQMRTVEALKSGASLVVNTYNTGTGKTLGSLLYLFELEGTRQDNVLFIAPTNELIYQHSQDIRAFVSTYNLPFRVVEVNAALLHQLAQGERGGETLYRLIRNPLDFYYALGISPDDHRHLPLILVTNPDIFYYALFWRYNAKDQRNLFQQFLTAFRYIVIDEFHYYNAKQFANFLFFFIISKEWGYFEEGRKICLLSATPASEILTYLNRVFDEEWMLVSPDNEPPGSEAYEKIPALTVLDLTLRAEALEAWAETNAKTVWKWLEAGKHGAIISSALWRVNQAYAVLKSVIPSERMGRITGPIPPEVRRVARTRDLILATPTVDIGYNFVKLNKKRQNLDFMVFDARWCDEALQRLGRAGRILGKPIIDVPSYAVGLVNSEALDALKELDGKTMTRADLARALESALPSRGDFPAYIARGGLAEAFYPIYQLRLMFPPNTKELEQLYEAVREIFAPSSRRTFQRLWQEFRRHSWRCRYLKQGDQKRIGHLLAEFIEWLNGVRYPPKSLEAEAKELLADRNFYRDFIEYLQARIYLEEARFSFRESFQGPEAVVYDPDHLLGDTEISVYDLVHIITHFEFEMVDKASLASSTSEALPQADFYLHIIGFREPPLHLALFLEADVDRKTFDQRYTGRVWAYRGFHLVAIKSRQIFPLTMGIVEALQKCWVVALIVHPEDRGALWQRLAHTPIFDRKLLVQFPDGKTDEYRAVLGTGAFLVEAEMAGYFQFKRERRTGNDPIIL